MSSDHSRWPVDNNFTSSIFEAGAGAGAGVPDLETLLPALFTGAKAPGYDAAMLTVEQLCKRPAKFFGVWPEKGALRIGADADIAILRAEPQVWDSTMAHDEMGLSPFVGREFPVRVARLCRRTVGLGRMPIVNAAGDGRYAACGASSWF